ncbi:unnamed protein product [Camellia sinensis]
MKNCPTQLEQSLGIQQLGTSSAVELSAIVPVREKQAIVKTAINKYGLAEDTSRTGGSVNVKEVSSNELFSQSAIYIVAAHALKPTYSVYVSALKLGAP